MTSQKRLRTKGEFILAIGLPGTGKSTLYSTLFEQKGYELVERDKFKDEFEGGQAAVYEMDEGPHKELKLKALEDFARRMEEHKFQEVYEGSGRFFACSSAKNVAKWETRLLRLKESGYFVRVIEVQTRGTVNNVKNDELRSRPSLSPEMFALYNSHNEATRDRLFKQADYTQIAINDEFKGGLRGGDHGGMEEELPAFLMAARSRYVIGEETITNRNIFKFKRKLWGEAKIHTIRALDILAQTVEMSVRIALEWSDPDLLFMRSEDNINWKEVWTCDMQISNLVGTLEEIKAPEFKLRATERRNEVKWIGSFHCTLQQSFDIKHFPYDDHLVKLSIRFPRTRDRYVEFASPLGRESKLLIGGTVRLDGWQIAEHDHPVVIAPIDGRATCTFQFGIRRHSWTFAMSTEVLVIMIVASNVCVFFVTGDTPADMYGNKVEIMVTILLSLVAFASAIRPTVPTSPKGLTSFDKLLLSCYAAFFALFAIEIAVSNHTVLLKTCEYGWAVTFAAYIGFRTVVVTCRQQSLLSMYGAHGHEHQHDKRSSISGGTSNHLAHSVSAPPALPGRSLTGTGPGPGKMQMLLQRGVSQVF
jgi:hypothetical protein